MRHMQGFMQRNVRIPSYPMPASGGTGFMQGTIKVANRYPLGGDTGSLSTSLHPTTALEATGTVATYAGLAGAGGILLGLVASKKHTIILGLAGVLGGYLYGSKVAAAASK